MFFFIIPILPCSGDWKNLSDLYIFAEILASLAQPVEQLIRNEQVVGSSPIGGSKKRPAFAKAMAGKSGKGVSNPRPSAWEADALPLSYSRLRNE